MSKEKERALAHVERIVAINPIPNYDRVELATVLGWDVIVGKGSHKVGDLVVFLEVDSQLPNDKPLHAEFEPLEKRKNRVRALKMCGVISQGFIAPLDVLDSKTKIVEGLDVTKQLGIVHLERSKENQKPLARDMRSVVERLSKRHWFLKRTKWLIKYDWFVSFAYKTFVPKPTQKRFPHFIVKTDETRLQALPVLFNQALEKDLTFSVTEKLHGTSTTFALQGKPKNKKKHFYVTSRNVVQLNKNQKSYYEENVYWEQALKYNVENVLNGLYHYLGANDHVVLQGETIGPKLLGNTYNLTERDFYAFNLIVDGRKLPSEEAVKILEPYDIKHVPILDSNFKLKPSIAENLELATGKSVLEPKALREGFVVRNNEHNISFKLISPEWLIKVGNTGDN